MASLIPAPVPVLAPPISSDSTTTTPSISNIIAAPAPVPVLFVLPTPIFSPPGAPAPPTVETPVVNNPSPAPAPPPSTTTPSPPPAANPPPPSTPSAPPSVPSPPPSAPAPAPSTTSATPVAEVAAPPAAPLANPAPSADTGTATPASTDASPVTPVPSAGSDQAASPVPSGASTSPPASNATPNTNVANAAPANAAPSPPANTTPENTVVEVQAAAPPPPTPSPPPPPPSPPASNAISPVKVVNVNVTAPPSVSSPIGSTNSVPSLFGKNTYYAADTNAASGGVLDSSASRMSPYAWAGVIMGVAAVAFVAVLFVRRAYFGTAGRRRQQERSLESGTASRFFGPNAPRQMSDLLEPSSNYKPVVQEEGWVDLHAVDPKLGFTAAATGPRVSPKMVQKQMPPLVAPLPEHPGTFITASMASMLTSASHPGKPRGVGIVASKKNRSNASKSKARSSVASAREVPPPPVQSKFAHYAQNGRPTTAEAATSSPSTSNEAFTLPSQPTAFKRSGAGRFVRRKSVPSSQVVPTSLSRASYQPPVRAVAQVEEEEESDYTSDDGEDVVPVRGMDSSVDMIHIQQSTNYRQSMMRNMADQWSSGYSELDSKHSVQSSSEDDWTSQGSSDTDDDELEP